MSERMPPATLTIVLAREDDLEAAAPLFDAYRTFFTGSADLAVSRQFLGDRLRTGDSAVLLAREAGNGVGFLQLYPMYSSWYARRMWFLSDLYVTEAARGRSVGKRLVEAAVAHAKETASSSVLVEVPRAAAHLKGFYEALGFCEDETFALHRLALTSRDGRASPATAS